MKCRFLESWWRRFQWYIGLPTFLLLFLLCVQSSKSCCEGSILTEPPPPQSPMAVIKHSEISSFIFWCQISFVENGCEWFLLWQDICPEAWRHWLGIRDLKHDDAFNTTWPPILSIDKCCQVTSLSIERTDHHVLLKVSSCLRCLLTLTHCRIRSENGEPLFIDDYFYDCFWLESKSMWIT